ncbi:MAG: polyribonucleotide nucleotidyltransferase [Parcubacteria group bacterium CG_4_10_14_0_2_um_filter_7_35_8]|nr:MAG: polyribonucleotide nucleotidyltransferase [Parcubacteria group bacterium CG10_big_fil_rev_8_21_14_0_10_35_15]PIZ77525.1 MAG: polyribonucleotide nucleotidyltransferase [Parcubacteria group bacterium CG_4_10_14_0_2_um_filter_7_35_8]
MSKSSEKFKLEIGNKELCLEIKNLAEQASGSIFVRYGDTVVLSTAVMSPNTPSQNFFPLTVDYEERYYAAGKIKGSRYMKREGRPSDRAILNGRLIDRTIRPRFPKEFFREVQVVTTVLSWDGQNEPDTIGIIAASMALSLSNIPWLGPLAAVRVGRINNEFVLNPSVETQEESEFELIISGNFKKDELIINMIEGQGDEVAENLIVEATEFAKPYLKQIIDFQNQVISKFAKPKAEITKENPEIINTAKEFLKGKLDQILFERDKDLRNQQETDLKQQLIDLIEEKYPNQISPRVLFSLFDDETDRVMTKNILEQDKRPDNRNSDQLREISCEVDVLPRTHGSGLFSRGQTTALSILTLGAPGDQQLLEGMEISGKKRFMLHYNFPPYSVGEVKPMRGPGRREIGHGSIGEKALLPLIPKAEDFPYTIRVVSEILSSNGSSSMASISGASLALMDAGVPIKSQAAGIAIGLVMDEETEKFCVLTDIQGPEDHHGDMDFKVAGTRKGITVIQMDVKISGITQEILKIALEKARKARLQILDITEKAISKPREKLSPYAPRILTIQINPNKIREVVGPGGKIINEIVSETGATIDIEQTGLIFITAETEDSAQKALKWIENITHETRVGETFQAKVTRLFDFGAMAEYLPNQEGLIHISELADYRVKKVEDIVKIGDIVPVKVIGIDQQGRTNLSLKEMLKDKNNDGGKTSFPKERGN